MKITLTKFNGLNVFLEHGPTYGYEELAQGTRLIMAGYTVDVVETLDEINRLWQQAFETWYMQELQRAFAGVT